MKCGWPPLPFQCHFIGKTLVKKTLPTDNLSLDTVLGMNDTTAVEGSTDDRHGSCAAWVVLYAYFSSQSPVLFERMHHDAQNHLI